MAEGVPDFTDFKPDEKTVHDTKLPTQATVPTGGNPDGPSGLGAEWRDWRVVMKALRGYNDLGGQTAADFLEANGGGWAQPETAFRYGDAFSKLAETLSYLSDALVTHTNKLFETWKGPGAKAYGEVINAASEMLRAQYVSIVAPPSGQDLQSLLYHVGNTLLWGQNQLTWVADAFARAAQAAGATVVTTEGAGRLTHISEFPELVEAKNEYFYKIASTVNNAFGSDRQMFGTPPNAAEFAPSSSGLNSLTDPKSLMPEIEEMLNSQFPNLNESLGAPGSTDASGNPISVPTMPIGAPPGLDASGNPISVPTMPTGAPPGLDASGNPVGGLRGAPSTPNGLDPAGFDPATGDALQIPSPNIAPPPGLGAGGGAPGVMPMPGLNPGLGRGGGGLPGSLPIGSPGGASRQQDGAAPVRVPQIDIGEPPAIGATPGAPGVPAIETGSIPSPQAPSVGIDGAGNRIEVPEIGIDGAPVGVDSPGSTSLGFGDGVGSSSSPGSVGSVGPVGSVGSVGTPGSVGSVGSVGSDGVVGTDGGVGSVSGQGTGTPSGASGDGVIPGGAPGGNAAGAGMPMYPPMMGGMGGAAGERRNDDSNTWLQEHRKPWDKDDGCHLVGASLGREGVSAEKERPRHHLRTHQEAFQHQTADRHVTASTPQATTVERQEQQEAVQQG